MGLEEGWEAPGTPRALGGLLKDSDRSGGPEGTRGSLQITLGNRARLRPISCLSTHTMDSLGAAMGKKPAAHPQIQPVAGQCRGVTWHTNLTDVNCTARLHL